MEIKKKMSRGLLLFVLGACAISPAFSPAVLRAETLDFGGYPERLKGNGDLEPPRCQFNVPRAATESFFIQWNCTDDVSDPGDIRTELWMLRNGALAPVKLADFLGFPASVFITEGHLQAATVAAGLPAAFRLLARDKAGVATLSPFVTVSSQDNSVNTCTLKLLTDTSDSADATAQTVLVSDARVNTQQTSSTDLKITTQARTLSNPCEIDAVCSDDSEVTFQATLELATGNAAKGTLSASPGDVFATVSGSASVENSALVNVVLTGKTAIDGVVTSVSLSCKQ